MKLHSESLVGDIHGQIVIQSKETSTEEQLHSGLLRAWEVWALNARAEPSHPRLRRPEGSAREIESLS